MLATVIVTDDTSVFPKAIAFLTFAVGNVNFEVPSVSVPFTVMVYLYPFVIEAFLIFVIVILLFVLVISVVFKLLTVISDSLSVHVRIISDVSLLAIGVTLHESNVQVGAVLSIAVTLIVLWVVLPASSLK